MELKGNCSPFTLFRRLLPSYSALARFPKLAFIKDNSAEYEAEMEFLMQKAKHNDSSSQNGTESEDSWQKELRQSGSILLELITKVCFALKDFQVGTESHCNAIKR